MEQEDDKKHYSKDTMHVFTSFLIKCHCKSAIGLTSTAIYPLVEA